jgi:hypothetical protein
MGESYCVCFGTVEEKGNAISIPCHESNSGNIGNKSISFRKSIVGQKTVFLMIAFIDACNGMVMHLLTGY